MSDDRIPELPSDEALGIAGMDADDPDAGTSDAPAEASGGPPASTGGGRRRTPRGGPPWRGPLTLLVLVIGCWFFSVQRTLPGTRPANAPDSTFASSRALSELVAVVDGPRPPGSPEHARVRDLLLARLEQMGLEPRIQTALVGGRGRDQGLVATVRNVVARVPGSDPTGTILLMAHYDSRGISPGAGDDGVGLSVVLETLRALRASDNLRNDLIVLLTDGEELGRLGARAFLEQHPWGREPDLVINLEMRGGGGPSIMFETGPRNGWIMERVARFDPRPLANSLSMEVYRRLPNDTDFSPFRDAGIQGLNFAAIGRSAVYHQAFDTPDRVQESTLQHHGVRTLALTRALGQADLSTVDGPARSFVTLPVVGLVTLPESWALPASGGLLALILVVAFFGSLRGVRTRAGIAAGVVSAVTLAVTAGAGWALLRWASTVHPEWGYIEPAFHREGPYVLALVAAAVAVHLTLLASVRRWVGRQEAALGSLVVPILALLAGTLMAPAAVINLQGPLLAALLLQLVLLGLGPDRAQGTAAWIATLVSGLVVLAFLVPVFELLAMSLTLRSAIVVGGAAAFVVLLLTPALDALGTPNRWWAPAVALGVALAGVGAGWLQADPAPDRPRPSTLVYAMARGPDGAPQEAYWGSRDDGGLAWARERTGETLDGSESLERFLFPPISYWTGAAPLLAVSPLELTVLADSVSPVRRDVRLALRSAVQAEMLALRLPDDVAIRGVGSAGPGGIRPDLVDPSIRTLRHWGEPDSALVVELTGPADPPWELEVVEHILRPAQLLGRQTFERPGTLTANVGARSDRVAILTPLRLAPPAAGEQLPESGATGPGAGTLEGDGSRDPSGGVGSDETLNDPEPVSPSPSSPRERGNRW